MLAPVTRSVEVVPYPAPVVTISEALGPGGQLVDPDRLTVAISVDNRASGGPCEIRFGDDSGPYVCQEVETVLHRYAPDGGSGLSLGVYRLVVISLADPTARACDDVRIPWTPVDSAQPAAANPH
jgi:hypothetical protein